MRASCILRCITKAIANYGSCDYAYVQYLVEGNISSDITLFVKDTSYNVQLHQAGGSKLVSVDKMLEEASLNGFACGMYFEYYNSSIVWADADVLGKFTISSYFNTKRKFRQSSYVNLRAFWEFHSKLFSNHHSSANFPTCYGGMFVINNSLIKDRSLYKLIQRDLVFDDVSHYMERSWASLFVEKSAMFYCSRLTEKDDAGSLGGSKKCE